MKRMHKTALISAVFLSIYSLPANAASLDFRHEYKHDSKSDGNRIKIGGSTGPHSYSVEMKFNNTDEDSYGFANLERGDSEFTYAYTHKFNDKWSIQFGLPVTFGDEKVTYKPQVRVTYKFENGVQAKLRYRHGIVDDNDGSSPDYNYGQLTGNLTYTLNKTWDFDFEANYYKNYDSSVKRFNNKATNYELNLKVGYRIPDTKWRPYIELGDTSVSSTSSDRQFRSRIGITYSF